MVIYVLFMLYFYNKRKEEAAVINQQQQQGGNAMNNYPRVNDRYLSDDQRFEIEGLNQEIQECNARIADIRREAMLDNAKANRNNMRDDGEE
jgi:hypothetical protein